MGAWIKGPYGLNEVGSVNRTYASTTDKWGFGTTAPTEFFHVNGVVVIVPGTRLASGVSRLIIDRSEPNVRFFSCGQNGSTNGGFAFYSIRSDGTNELIPFKINNTGSVSLLAIATASAPAYVEGALYYDTTLHKLRVGGAAAWETVTSA